MKVGDKVICIDNALIGGFHIPYFTLNKEYVLIAPFVIRDDWNRVSVVNHCFVLKSEIRKEKISKLLNGK